MENFVAEPVDQAAGMQNFIAEPQVEQAGTLPMSNSFMSDPVDASVPMQNNFVAEPSTDSVNAMTNFIAEPVTNEYASDNGFVMPSSTPASAGGADPFASAGPAGGGMDSFPPPIDSFNSAPMMNNEKNDGGDVTKLREWEHAHEVELEKKAQQETESKQDMRRKAAEELTNWYAERKANEEKRKATNRSDEQVLVSEREAANQVSANPWERVMQLIDTAPQKVDKEEAEAKKSDLSRMKQVLIQLKANPLPPA